MSKTVFNLEKRTAQLAAQLEVAQARLKDEKRRAETRQKILMGAALLSAYEKDPAKIRPFILQLVKTELSDRDRKFVQSVFDDVENKTNAKPSGDQQNTSSAPAEENQNSDLDGFLTSAENEGF